MPVCKSCGEEGSEFCKFCRYGPSEEEMYHHHTSHRFCDDTRDICEICGSSKIEVDSVGTEWGYRLYCLKSTITGKITCITCPFPRKCKTCLTVFPSGNSLFRHLQENSEHIK